MARMLVQWVLSALTLLVISHFVRGFVIVDLFSAMIAVVMIGLLNATLGLLLRIITFPIVILTFGMFLLVINAVVLWLSSEFVPGFRVETFRAAFMGALAITIVHILFRFVRTRSRPAAAWK